MGHLLYLIRPRPDKHYQLNIQVSRMPVDEKSRRACLPAYLYTDLSQHVQILHADSWSVCIWGPASVSLLCQVLYIWGGVNRNTKLVKLTLTTLAVPRA